MKFYVYVLRSTNNQLYIGQTNNLVQREKQHLVKKSKAAKFVRDEKVFNLVYFEEYPTRLESVCILSSYFVLIHMPKKTTTMFATEM